MSNDSNPKDFLNKMLLTGNITFDGKHLLLMGRPGLLLNAEIKKNLLKMEPFIEITKAIRKIADLS